MIIVATYDNVYSDMEFNKFFFYWGYDGAHSSRTEARVSLIGELKPFARVLLSFTIRLTLLLKHLIIAWAIRISTLLINEQALGGFLQLQNNVYDILHHIVKNSLSSILQHLLAFDILSRTLHILSR